MCSKDLKWAIGGITANVLDRIVNLEPRQHYSINHKSENCIFAYPIVKFVLAVINKNLVGDGKTNMNEQEIQKALASIWKNAKFNHSRRISR
jgi:hypothetical protein